MKVILAGSSGFIGSEILTQCLLHPSITSVVALSRRPLSPALPAGANDNAAKLQTIILSDFGSENAYTDNPELLSACRGAEACVWALGAPTTDAAAARRINFDFVRTAATVMVNHIAPTPAEVENNGPDDRGDKRRPFRFVMTSGFVAERDQSAKLWYLERLRKIAGETETTLLLLARAHSDIFRTYITKPSFVYRNNGFSAPSWSAWLGIRLWSDVVARVFPVIGVRELAAASVELAVFGDPVREKRAEGDVDERSTYYNAELVQRGRASLTGSNLN